VFITDELSPAEVLSELISVRGTDPSDTKAFRQLRHNRHLCPRFRERVDNILEAYSSHRTAVYDIQGPRDEGVDVLLEWKASDGDHSAGLQIISFHEMEGWVGKKNRHFMNKLKSQYVSATQNLGVDVYYLVLCTDAIAHQDHIRFICSELKSFGDLKIVLPPEALSFFQMSQFETALRVTRLLCSQDALLKTAIDDAANLEGPLAYMTISLLCMAFEGKTFVSDRELFDLYQNWDVVKPLEENSEDPNETLERIVGELEGRTILTRGDSDFLINIPDFPTSFCALYFDQKHRHASITRRMSEYLCALLKITQLA
jgi:hypothetical protein